MKIYLKVVGLLAFIAVVLGFLGPFMISQRDSFMVILGFASLSLVFVPVVAYAVKNIYQDVKSKFSNQSVKE